MVRWYVINAVNGRELSICEKIRESVDAFKLSRHVRELTVPTRPVTDPDGKRKLERPYPGYILIQADIVKVFSVVKRTPGVLCFLGGDQPVAISDTEAAEMLGAKSAKQVAARGPRFEAGDHVRIIRGPLTDYPAEVKSVDESKGQITVEVQIFGRATPATVELAHVTRER